VFLSRVKVAVNQLVVTPTPVLSNAFTSYRRFVYYVYHSGGKWHFYDLQAADCSVDADEIEHIIVGERRREEVDACGHPGHLCDRVSEIDSKISLEG
jgi:hypothetical protein